MEESLTFSFHGCKETCLKRKVNLNRDGKMGFVQNDSHRSRPSGEALLRLSTVSGGPGMFASRVTCSLRPPARDGQRVGLDRDRE